MPSEGGVLSAEGGRVPSESVMLHLEGGIMPSEGGIQNSDVDMMLLEGGILRATRRLQGRQHFQRAASYLRRAVCCPQRAAEYLLRASCCI